MLFYTYSYTYKIFLSTQIMNKVHIYIKRITKKNSVQRNGYFIPQKQNES
jgi:hypothetical protein